MSVWRRIRTTAAAYLLDAPRYGFVLRTPGLASCLGKTWVDLHNRGDHLERAPNQRGVLLRNHPWSRALFYCQAYPQVGQLLLKRALNDWPIQLADKPAWSLQSEPDITFIIGHRGTSRVPHLQATLASIAAQSEVTCECLVVEQSTTAELKDVLPRWVRHLHTPPPRPDMPYSRSWAFNVGARSARSQYLVFHDNDISVPARYAADLLRVFRQGFQAARLLRYLFYLSEAHTADVFTRNWIRANHSPLSVIQNCQGGTIAVERSVYFDIGGHDESFIGWGGEDNELFDRLSTHRLHDHAYLPFVHLHHASQPGTGLDRPNNEYFDTRMALPACQRISELRQRAWGSADGPNLMASPMLKTTSS